MCIQRETGAHRAVKVIKREVELGEEHKSKSAEEKKIIKAELEKNIERELRNEIGRLCSLVSDPPLNS